MTVEVKRSTEPEVTIKLEPTAHRETGLKRCCTVFCATIDLNCPTIELNDTFNDENIDCFCCRNSIKECFCGDEDCCKRITKCFKRILSCIFCPCTLHGC